MGRGPRCDRQQFGVGARALGEGCCLICGGLGREEGVEGGTLAGAAVLREQLRLVGRGARAGGRPFRTSGSLGRHLGDGCRIGLLRGRGRLGQRALSVTLQHERPRRRRVDRPSRGLYPDVPCLLRDEVPVAQTDAGDQVLRRQRGERQVIDHEPDELLRAHAIGIDEQAFEESPLLRWRRAVQAVAARRRGVAHRQPDHR